MTKVIALKFMKLFFCMITKWQCNKMYSLKLESMFCQSELHSLKEEDKLTIEIQAESATEMVNKEVSQETEVAGQRWLSL